MELSPFGGGAAISGEPPTLIMHNALLEILK